MPVIEAGAKAPNFSGKTSGGGTASLQDYADKALVLWWYPKASTPGWTIEGREFRDLKDQFDAAGAAILGASFDTVDENTTFCKAEGFPFPLLCDKDKKIGKAYGVAEGDHAARATFVIKDGEIKQVWPKVSPQGHAQEVLDFVKTL